MPIPRPTDSAAAPRRLLRDVVLDKLYGAIADGTLEFGERLNDDELVAWLGVSRTPVREAIAKLSEQGLVEIEANRYTRVVAPTHEQFVDTVTTTIGLWSLAAERGVPRISDDDIAAIGRHAAVRTNPATARSPESVDALFDLFQVIVQATASPSLIAVEQTVGRLTNIMFRRLAEKGLYPWHLAGTVTADLAVAISERDGAEAKRLFEAQLAAMGPFFEGVRTTGLYPSHEPV